MRRLLVVRFDAFQFDRLHGSGRPLDFFFQALQQFALLEKHAVHLLDLMFEVCEVRLQPVGASGIFVCHGTNLPPRRREVEPVNDF